MPKWTEPDQPMTTGTRKGDRKRTGMRYNRYGDDFLIDKTQPDEISEELVNVGEPVADEEKQIINDSIIPCEKTTQYRNEKTWNKAR